MDWFPYDGDFDHEIITEEIFNGKQIFFAVFPNEMRWHYSPDLPFYISALSHFSRPKVPHKWQSNTCLSGVMIMNIFFLGFFDDFLPY